jgi:type 1 glutamine amidotransferase
VVDGSGGPDVQTALARALSDFEQAVRPTAARRVAELARSIPIKGPERLRPAEREQIAAAIPTTLAATPKRPRRLLVFDANIGYGGNTGGHRSIGAATMLIEQYGRATGAYDAVFSNDVDNFRYEVLRQFDAVFLNNTAGIIFVDQEHRDGLVRFIREGGGLAAYHGASHASMDWPEFRRILGAVGGGHKMANEVATVRIDDPENPVTAAFEGRPFVHADEFYRFTDEVLSRDRVHVLMSIDVAHTDMNQPGNCSSCERSDQDYILSWIRHYGKGRVFYTSLGHNPSFFTNERMNRFFLAGLQFELGDLEADATPSARVLSPSPQ